LDKLAGIYYEQKQQVFNLPFDKLFQLLKTFFNVVDSASSQEAYARKRGPKMYKVWCNRNAETII